MDYSNLIVPRGTLDKYINLLEDWNKKINLVSYGARDELYTRHILDSLQLIEYIFPEEEVFDIGSGAGFPGLMLSYAGIKKVNLVEKIEKKCDFLNVASSFSNNIIKIYNQDVKTIRTESCDIITSRGLAEIEEIFNLTTNIMRDNTRFILLKGKNFHYEIKNALVKWNFEYIIHKSKTSEDGQIIEIRNLIRK